MLEDGVLLEGEALRLAMVEVVQGVSGLGEGRVTLTVPAGTEHMGQFAAPGRMWREFEDVARVDEPEAQGTPPPPQVEVAVRARCGVCGQEVLADRHLAQARPKRADIKPSTSSLLAAAQALSASRRSGRSTSGGNASAGHGWRRSAAFGWVCHGAECRERAAEADPPENAAAEIAGSLGADSLDAGPLAGTLADGHPEGSEPGGG